MSMVPLLGCDPTPKLCLVRGRPTVYPAPFQSQGEGSNLQLYPAPLLLWSRGPRLAGRPTVCLPACQSPRSGSNRQPMLYKSIALPIELRGHTAGRQNSCSPPACLRSLRRGPIELPRHMGAGLRSAFVVS